MLQVLAVFPLHFYNGADTPIAVKINSKVVRAWDIRVHDREQLIIHMNQQTNTSLSLLTADTKTHTAFCWN